MSFTIHQGDVLERLREMHDQSVHCVVTSPPYWGLRDYGTARWDGGSGDCDHLMPRGGQGKTGDRADRTHTQRVPYKDVCGRCGAVRVDQQIGLEPTPEAFVEKMVEVFSEVRRVLRDDGTCWVNLGDSYCSQGGPEPQQTKYQVAGASDTQNGKKSRTATAGLKPKDLVGIPWRVALALQADGWWLRQDIIWHKPNHMPESVRDRCTKAHEYIFLLTKSERYFYNSEAIKEPTTADHPPGNKTHSAADAYESGDEKHRTKAGLVAYAAKHRPSAEKGSFSGKTETMAATGQNAFRAVTEFRNKRSVWTIASMPTPEAHFATFPLELPELCLRAGSPEGGAVLDPFSGAGTTGLACLKHGRDYIGIELNPEYVEIAMSRARKVFPLLLAG